MTGECVVTIPTRNTKKLKAHKGSQTPGKLKGERCMTGKMKKFFACAPHAWKHPQYGVWHQKFKDMNNQRIAV